MKYKIIRKSYLNLHITNRSRISRWCFTYQINSKEASGKVCEIWIKLRLYKDIATFQILQTWIGYAAKFEKLP